MSDHEHIVLGWIPVPPECSQSNAPLGVGLPDGLGGGVQVDGDCVSAGGPTRKIKGQWL